MWKFEHPYMLYLLFAIPLLVLIMVLNRWRRKKAIEKFGEPELIGDLTPYATTGRYSFKSIIILIAFVIGVLMLADPKVGSKMKTVKREGIELMFCLDVSNSMLAEDIKPNRLQRAKLSISKLLNKLHSDKVGIVIFAGDAFTQLPITTDYSAAKMFLRTIKTNSIPVQGTSIGKAIDQAKKSFSSNESTKKAIIVITDGENHEDDAIEAAKAAAESGVIVNTVGLGSRKGEPIPVYNRYGNKSYRKDKDGSIVMTKLNESLLSQVATAGGGKFYKATNSGLGINQLIDEIEKMDKAEFDSEIFSDYEDQFQIFAAILLFFLLLELMILPRKNKLLSKVNIFKLKV